MGAAKLLSGFVFEVGGADVEGRLHIEQLEKVPLVAVVDTTDTHHKVTTNTPTHGSQKSLAFSIAWLRQQFRRPSTFLR